MIDCPVFKLYNCSHANTSSCNKDCDIRYTHESCNDIQPQIITEYDTRIEQIMRKRYVSRERQELIDRGRLRF